MSHDSHLDRPKILVIGVDGATFDIINPLVERGELPTIAKLMKEGVHGRLRSTIPPASIPAWPSFMTGVNPGKHGCFDFMKRYRDDYYGRVITSKDIKSKTLWRLLSDFGYKIIAINVTGTYPPEEINGILISGLLTPKGKNFTYSWLQKRLEDEGYRVFLDDDVLNTSDDEFLFSELCKLEEKRIEVAINLMNEYNWNFFMVMLIGTDTIQHKLWGNKELIFQYYQKIDELISKIIQGVTDSAYIFIVSDHGFGSLRKIVNINVFLHSLGLLNYTKKDIYSTREFKIKSLREGRVNIRWYKKLLLNLGVTREDIAQTFGKIPPFEVVYQYLPKRVKNIFRGLPKSNVDIDWANTKAFLASFYGTETQSIVINLKGREPKGIVDQNEYDELREYLIKELKELRDPETGEKIFESVFKREDIYKGPYVNEAPDIITLLKPGYKFSNTLRAKNVVIPLNGVEGKHEMCGVLIAFGPDIKRGVTIENIQIIDMVPTILHIMNLPIPKYIDGRVLREIFVEDSDLANREIIYYEKEEKEEIKNKIRRLKTLGKI